MSRTPARPSTCPPTRSRTRRALLACGLGIAVGRLPAQTPVYESRDKQGPVFSDRPMPGAKPVEVGPTNVVPSSPVPAAASAPDPAAAADAPPPYRSLVFSSPANQGTVHSNTGAFEVVLRASPGLRSNAGDRIQLMLDGTVLPKSYASNRIQLNESDWQAAAAGDGVQHTMQAAIVDASGRVLITSVPIVFYAHRAAVGRRAR
jgi:hypothetical protein